MARIEQELEQEIIRRYSDQNFYSRSEIATDLEVSVTTVTNVLQRNGIQNDKPYRKKARDVAVYREKDGYIYINQKPQHVLLAAMYLGVEELPTGAIVHHMNHDRKDNRRANLCVFPDNSSHLAWHRYTDYVGAKVLTSQTYEVKHPSEFGGILLSEVE